MKVIGESTVRSPDSEEAEMTPALYDIVRWVRDHGEVQAENRLRIRTLPLTMREGISFAQIGPHTRASPQLVSAMLREATFVVGREYSR